MLMLKSEEIAILREAAKKLGPNSYIGPWLLEVIPQVEWAIKSDFLPDVEVATVQDSTREAARIVNDAVNTASFTIEAAKRRAGQITEGAVTYRNGIIERAEEALQACLRDLRR